MDQLKKAVKKAVDKTPLKDTVLVERFDSKTPKGWKIVGTIAKVLLGLGSLAYGFTPPGWMTYTAIGVVALGLGAGTVAGYQTDDPELKKLWMRPFRLFKKK